MDYGVSKYGFRKKTYDDLKIEIEDRTRQLFGANINLSVFSPVGLFVRLLAWALSLVWADYENAYYQNWIDDAEGVNLDKLVAFASIQRNPPQKSVATLQFVGTNGVVIAKGFVAQTPQKIKFATLADVTIVAGSATVQAQSIDAGAKTAGISVGSINEIYNPQAGVTSVTNIDASIGGSDIETDDELRQRFKDSRQLGQGGSVPGIYSKLKQVPGLLEAYIYENTSAYFDEETRPPSSIECVVYGGTDADIADTIFRKAAGVGTFGTTSFLLTDGTGQIRTIKFSRATAKYIYVKVHITKNPLWNPGNITAVQSAVIKYIGGIDTIGASSTSYRGLTVGSKTYTWKIAAAMKEIVGIDSLSVLIGFNLTPTTSDLLAVGIREIPRTDNAHIIVEVV